jgi:hypothetical protein
MTEGGSSQNKSRCIKGTSTICLHVTLASLVTSINIHVHRNTVTYISTPFSAVLKCPFARKELIRYFSTRKQSPTLPKLSGEGAPPQELSQEVANDTRTLDGY